MKVLREEFKLSSVWLIVIALGLVLLLITIALLLSLWQKSFPPGAVLESPPLQSPRRQVEFDSGQLARNLKAEQQTQLSTYGWKDPQHHFAKVPIQRAMEFLVEQSAERKEK